MKHPIHQFVHTLSYGDAISGEVLALQRVFRSAGIVSEIYCINVHPKLKGQAHDYREFSSREGAGFSGEVIHHYSLGSPLNALYLELTSARRTLVFHNLTPSHWFDGINPRIVEDIESGKRELPGLLRVSHRVLADSLYNASELAELGFQAEVLELPVDPARWDLPSNPGIAQLLQSKPAIDVLHVGRLAPNKCIEDILKTFYFLHYHVNPNSRLWLVGIDIDTELYSFALKRLCFELHLEDSVNFVGCMDDTEVKALYENASVYLCMSEHEGFCLPVIEAMHFGLPVIAYESTALGDTVGPGGILVREKRYPEIAELIAELQVNRELRGNVIEAGKQRVQSLSFDKFAKRVQSIFLNVLPELSQGVG